MLSQEEFIRMSLENNLFWIRIMKEHAFFIQSSLPPVQKSLALQANRFMQQFERLLELTIKAANGWISKEALQSGQYYTRYTIEAERVAQQFTGITINRNLTYQETNIEPKNPSTKPTPKKEREVSLLNQQVIKLLDAFLKFKADLLSSQTTCRIFTFQYTAVLDHILREGREYDKILKSIQRKEMPIEDVPPQDENFWNRIMADHSKTMRGYFDPTEAKLFNEADQFAKIFDALSVRETGPGMKPPINEASLIATTKLSEFKSENTQGLLSCKVKAIMLALFTDHLLREANHYIRLLKS